MKLFIAFLISLMPITLALGQVSGEWSKKFLEAATSSKGAAFLESSPWPNTSEFTDLEWTAFQANLRTSLNAEILSSFNYSNPSKESLKTFLETLSKISDKIPLTNTKNILIHDTLRRNAIAHISFFLLAKPEDFPEISKLTLPRSPDPEQILKYFVDKQPLLKISSKENLETLCREVINLSGGDMINVVTNIRRAPDIISTSSLAKTDDVALIAFRLGETSCSENFLLAGYKFYLKTRGTNKWLEEDNEPGWEENLRANNQTFKNYFYTKNILTLSDLIIFKRTFSDQKKISNFLRDSQ